MDKITISTKMDNRTAMNPAVPHTDFNKLRELMNKCADTCQKKDQEYGASWCKRGGIGAFFTIWRKVDRLETQLKDVDYDMFDMSVDRDQTECLDETMLDLANYLYLVLEKRQAIRETQASVTKVALDQVPRGSGTPIPGFDQFKNQPPPLGRYPTIQPMDPGQVFCESPNGTNGAEPDGRYTNQG